jgi:hypothetical protein
MKHELQKHGNKTLLHMGKYTLPTVLKVASSCMHIEALKYIGII